MGPASAGGRFLLRPNHLVNIFFSPEGRLFSRLPSPPLPGLSARQREAVSNRPGNSGQLLFYLPANPSLSFISAHFRTNRPVSGRRVVLPAAYAVKTEIWVEMAAP